MLDSKEIRRVIFLIKSPENIQSITDIGLVKEYKNLTDSEVSRFLEIPLTVKESIKKKKEKQKRVDAYIKKMEYEDKIKELKLKRGRVKTVQRANKYAKMRTEQKLTLREIADKEEVSHQYVRQILNDSFGSSLNGHFISKQKIETRACEKCKKKFTCLAWSSKKYCSKECCCPWVVLIGKPQKEWTKEDWQKRDKIRNSLPKAIEGRRRYFERNKKKIYQKNREYHRRKKLNNML